MLQGGSLESIFSTQHFGEGTDFGQDAVSNRRISCLQLSRGQPAITAICRKKRLRDLISHIRKCPRHAASVTAVEQMGIRISSLVAEGNNDINFHKLFMLNTTMAQDEPTYDGSAKYSFETRKARIAGYPPCQFLAIDGDNYVGSGAVGFEPDGQAFNAFTEVLPAYRGLKIAQALKCKGIEFAQVVGAKTIRTGNDSWNVPMLVINGDRVCTV
jgi:hypothetical protein